MAEVNLGRVQGYSAYEVWLQEGHTGTELDYLASLKGEEGKTPVKGTDYWTEQDKNEIVGETTGAVTEEIQPKLDEISGNVSEANTAAEEAVTIAKGANVSLSFGNYASMISVFNALGNDVYRVGQNIMIVTLNVPDLWVSEIAETSTAYTYTSDEEFTNELKTNGTVQVGFYKLSALETQKVDLTDYVKNTDVASNNTNGNLGLVKGSGNSGGITINSAGSLYITKATEALIDGRTNNYAPIVPSNLVYAVQSVVGGHVTLTQAEYDALVEAGTVDENTYYYIKEE